MKLGIEIGGHFEADGNAVNLILGFVPEYIEIVNLNAAAGEIMKVEWYGSEMADSKDIVTRRLTDNGATATDTVEYRSSGGTIQDYNTVTHSETSNALTSTGGKGVTIAAAFMDDGDEIYYRAKKFHRYQDHGDINA